LGTDAAIFSTSPSRCSVSGHHVVVGRRDRRRQRDLELDRRRDDALPRQALEQAPGFDRHLGIAGREAGGVGGRAGPYAQAGDFAQDLAVPLRELEGRDVGAFDRRIFGEDVLQEADPGPANAGLAVGQASEMRTRGCDEGAEHGLGIRQRDAADEMHDRMFVVT
jgi:hypothetical protein